MTSQVPNRVTVTRPVAPRLSRVEPGGRVVADIDEQTELGQVYLRSLMRAQLMLGLRVCLSVCGGLAAVPALLVFFPALLGLPLSWLVVGMLPYPVLIAGGWWYVRRAERNERTFADLVERS